MVGVGGEGCYRPQTSPVPAPLSARKYQLQTTLKSRGFSKSFAWVIASYNNNVLLIHLRHKELQWIYILRILKFRHIHIQ